MKDQSTDPTTPNDVRLATIASCSMARYSNSLRNGPQPRRKGMILALRQERFQEARAWHHISSYHRYCAQFLTALIQSCDQMSGSLGYFTYSGGIST